jgi:hypothetical protein
MVGRADLYIALRQLKAGGVYACICADRWMLTQYSAERRRFITASCAVDNAPAFADEVSAYPGIVVTQ